MDRSGQRVCVCVSARVSTPLFLVRSGGGAMTGWNGSNFLFLVGGRRTCGQAQNMAKGPASWAQSCGLVQEEKCLRTVHALTQTYTRTQTPAPILEGALSHKDGI